MNACSWILLLFLYILPCTTQLLFKKQNITHEYPETLSIGSIADNTTADVTSSGSSYNILYGITAGNDNNTFQISKLTGEIVLAKNLDRENQEVFRLIKTAHINNGSVSMPTVSTTITILVLDVNDNPPVCPQKVSADVREIAPVGEVAVLLGCKDDDKASNSESNYTITPPSKSYFPFRVSNFGAIVVKEPVTYLQGAANVFIFVVEVSNVKPILTGTPKYPIVSVNVELTIKQTGCSTKWSYATTDNTRIQNNSVVMETLNMSNEARCKSRCNQLQQCHSFDFNQSKGQCRLTTETLFTQPAAFIQRNGHTVFRRKCDVEPLPSPYLRNLLPKMNISKSIQLALSTVIGLYQFLIFDGEKTSSDAHVAAEILLSLMSNTDFNNSKESHVINLIEFVNDCMSKLLEPYSLKLWIRGLKYGHQPYALVETLELMTDVASKHIYSDIHVTANNSALMSYHNAYQFVNIGLPDKNSSGVYLFDGNNGASSTRLAVGILEGLETLLSPSVQNLRSLNETVNKTILGHILSVNYHSNTSSTFQQPSVILDIRSQQVDGNYNNTRRCVFLESGERNLWKTDGCRVKTYNNTHTRCECDHLTNFALLMQVRDFNTTTAIRNSLENLTLIGCSASIASLVTTIVTLIYLNLKSDRYILLMNLSVALILAQIIFLAGVHATELYTICRMVAVLLHYFYLSVFTLMLAEGIQMYNKVYRPFAKDKNFFMYLCLGWGAPVVIVGISLATDLNGYGTKNFCWLSSIRGTIWAFVAPALTVITINAVILTMVIRTFLGVRVIAKRTEREKYKSGAKAAAVLLPLLGVTWTFGVLAIDANTVIFQYIFALLNSAQGVFILIFHVVLNDDVKIAIRRRRRRTVGNTHIAMGSHTDITMVNAIAKIGTSDQAESKPGKSNT